MELGLPLLITAIIAGAVAGALLRTWSIQSRLYSLENRLSVVEGITTREVKIRASAERWKKPSKDEEAIAAALANPPPPEKKKNWWELPNVARSYGGK